MVRVSSSRLGYGPELQCCKKVVDPVTLLAVLAGIAGISFVLRQAAINNIAGRRKREAGGYTLMDTLVKGKN